MNGLPCACVTKPISVWSAARAALTDATSTTAATTAARCLTMFPPWVIEIEPRWRSHRGQAAVHDQQRSGHVRGVVRGHECDGAGNFLGLRAALERYGFHERLVRLVERHLGHDRRERVPGDHDVHPDTLRGVVDRHHPREAMYATLARGIRATARRASVDAG